MKFWLPGLFLAAILASPGAHAQIYRQPGQPPAVPEPETPGAVAPPSPDLDYPVIPVPDRARIMDALGVSDDPLNPYKQNTIKGDRPVFDDWYVELGLVSDSLVEARAVPVPTDMVATYNATDASPFGRPRQLLWSQTLIPSFSLIKGDTTFEPPEIELRVTPAVNWTGLNVNELGLVNIDPGRGTVRNSYFNGLQEAFVDVHLRNVSERYDFDAIRVGIQPFNADFRGFLFQDQQLGVRLLGDRDNNRIQYNLAYFRRIEKDTDSGLNDVAQPLRRDNIALANVYVQDMPDHGFTTELSAVYNWNDEVAPYYDKDGFFVRPAAVGLEQPHKYSVLYLGLNGDGHFGRLNLTHSFYAALGNDSLNMVSGQKARIRAWFAALEPSMDFDWLRLRGSALYASGDAKPGGHTEGGFDAINENPQFAGADTSYWIRQAIPLIGGGGVALSGRNGLLASLRAGSVDGQSNFINPGLTLFGLGADVDVLPELRLSGNANHLWFNETEILKILREQAPIPRDIGWDLSLAANWRPFDTQNVVLRLSGAVLLPGDGIQALESAEPASQVYYSVLSNLILTF